MGQDEFYGEQYGHTQSSSEPINQQYYPDGNHASSINSIHTAFKHLNPHYGTCHFLLAVFHRPEPDFLQCWSFSSSSQSFFPYCGRWKVLKKKLTKTDIGLNSVSSQCVCVHTVPFGVPKFQISESVIAGCWGESANFLQGVSLCIILKWEPLKMLFVLIILSLHMYYKCFLASNWIIISLLHASGFCLCRGVFACVELCSLQVMGSTHINSPHMVSKATTGPLMSPHSTTMKEVTVSHFVILKHVLEIYFPATPLCPNVTNYSKLSADMCTCVNTPPGNSQYSQQQAQYQQGSGQQQPFSQQQYSSQQGYSGQPQGYGKDNSCNRLCAFTEVGRTNEWMNWM